MMLSMLCRRLLLPGLVLALLTACSAGTDVLSPANEPGANAYPTPTPSSDSPKPEPVGEGDVIDAEIPVPEIDYASFGGLMPEPQKEALQTEVDSAIRNSKSAVRTALTAEQRANQIVAAIKNIPGVWRAERTKHNDVVVQYSDGSPYIHLVGSVTPTRPTQPLFSRSRIAGTQPRSLARTSATAQGAKEKIPGGIDRPGAPHPERENVVLPTGNQAVLVDVDNTGSTSVPVLKKMLQDHGYQVKVSGGTLEDLESDMQNVDVAWLSSHGVSVDLLITPYANPIPIYVVSTNSPRFEKCELDPHCEKRKYQLTRTLIVKTGSDPDNMTHFGITSYFVSTHFSFRKNAFFFLNTCSGMHPTNLESNTFTNALQRKGASGVMGWSGLVYESATSAMSQKVFDLVLGNNQFSNMSPKQRPFSIDAIHQYLVETGQDVGDSPLDPAKLRYKNSGSKSIALVPSLILLKPYEKDSTAYLYGEFSDRALSDYEAELNGSSLTVESASSGRMKVTLPNQLLHGQVQVKVDGRKSNKVPLTLWQGRITTKNIFKNCMGKTFGEPGITLEITCNPMRFRADAHGYRTRPGGPIMGRPDGSGESYIEDQVKDTDCDYQVTGQSEVPKSHRWTPADSAHGTLPWMHHENSRSTPWNFVLGNVDVNDKKLELIFNYFVTWQNNTEAWRQSPAPGHWEPSSPVQFMGLPNVPGLSQHSMRLDSSFSFPNSGGPVEVPYNAGPMSACKYTYEGQLTAESPPDDSTAH